MLQENFNPVLQTCCLIGTNKSIVTSAYPDPGFDIWSYRIEWHVIYCRWR